MSEDLMKSAFFKLPGFPGDTFDQGSRNTCVASALAAMLEYYLQFSEKLSVQYIYAASIQAQSTSGISFESAFDAVKKYGVCRNSEWPYNSNASDSEGQIRQGMLQSIPTIKFDQVRFAFFKTDPPQGIDEYKSVLCGANGNAPSPVMVGCRMFDSAFRNSKWLQMPQAMEEVANMHAMLIYGWRDTPGMESKGYFLARNSYNSESDIKIEYEYIENHAVAAAALAVDKLPEVEKAPEEDSVVKIVDTQAVVSAAADTASAVPVMSDAGVIAVKKDFFSTQRDNMKGQYSFPGIKLPFPQNCGAFWFVNTQDAFFRHPGNDTPEMLNDYLDSQKITNLRGEVQIFRIQIRKGYYYRLFSVFLVREDRQEITPADLDVLDRFARHYRRGDGKNVPRHTFFTVATAGRFSSDCQAQSEPTVFLCERSDEGIWYFRMPDAKCGWVTQEFFRHILPGSYTGHLEKAMRRISGHITVKSLKDQFHIPAGMDIYDRTLEYSLNRIFEDAAAQGKPYARNRAGNILVPGTSLPGGYKKCKFYRRPPHKWYWSMTFWTAMTIILLTVSTVWRLFAPEQSRGFTVVPAIFTLLLLGTGIMKNKSLQKYKY